MVAPMTYLKAAPARLRTPVFATYRGESTFDLPRGLAALRTEKKWQWFSAFFDDVVVGGAVVDLRYAAKVFVWVFNRHTGAFEYEQSRTLLPGTVKVGDDALRHEIAQANGVQITRPRISGHWEVRINWPGLDLDVNLEAGPDPFTAVCPVAGHPERYNVTRKQIGLQARGGMRLGGHFQDLGHGHGLLDHSHGLLARTTTWKWAMGGLSGKDGLGFNAIQGFNDDRENCLWLGEELIFFDRTEIRQGESNWSVKSSCGRVDLEMEVEGVREEDVNLKLVKSVYRQPLGVWRGKLLGEDVEFAGVAEDHLAKW